LVHLLVGWLGDDGWVGGSDARRRDPVEKLDDYAVFGVRWYWLIDPAARILEIYELGTDGRYARACAATDAMLTDVPGCPGLTIALPALWARLDRLQAEGGAGE
jgi:Uma2 family endonuclease